MSYDFSFDKKSVFFIVGGCFCIGILLFFAGFIVGWDRGGPATRSVVEKHEAAQPADSTAANPPAPQTAAKPAIEGSAAKPADAAPAAKQEKPSAGTPETSSVSATQRPNLSVGANGDAKTADGKADAAPAETGFFSLQVGAFQDKAKAIDLENDLKSRGYSVFLFNMQDADGKVLHAVRMGHYADMKQASAAKAAFAGKEKIAVIISHQ